MVPQTKLNQLSTATTSENEHTYLQASGDSRIITAEAEAEVVTLTLTVAVAVEAAVVHHL